jgi:5-formyltetrahydrofolate cyclo-ligase
LEWGILSQQGNLNADNVLVVTTVHDCQVFDAENEPWKSVLANIGEGEGIDEDTNTPFRTLTQHDVPVDIIVTPTRIIRVSNRLPKPSGVFWELLSPQKLAQIRVLQQLKQKIEQDSGVQLPSGPDEVLPPLAERKGRGGRGRGGRGRGAGRGRGRGGRSQRNNL